MSPREQFVARSQGRIFVRDYPGTGPAFVLMHGFPDDGRIYDDLIPELVQGGRRVVVFDFLGFGLPPGSPSLGELLSQGKANVQAPWLGFTGFFSVAIMLSLLIFIGEGVRDAFDPRKTFR